MAAGYIELHCHSAFSFLDGASLPEELATAAHEHGYDALALTDHNSVSGSMEFAQAAAAIGLRAIHGAEVDLADGRHLTLLVEGQRGWRSLCRLLTASHARTRDPGNPPPKGPSANNLRTDPKVELDDVIEWNEGLVCLTGCASRGVRDEVTARRLLDAFGPDRLRVELQRPFLRGDRERNRALAALARRLGVPCVATGNVHAHAPRRALLQDAFVAVRLHTTLDASEPERRGNRSHALASPAAMAARFADHPDAVAETRRLAERLDFDLTRDLGYRYPGSDDDGADRELASLCRSAFDRRYARDSNRSAAEARLEEELRLIRELGLSGFFCLHHDLLELAREVAAEVRGPQTARALLPPGRGRGSSVSSIVCYLTGLSHVDPIRNGLFLGRFLNDDITSFPDIDLDFPRDVREVLIPRVHERYGRDRSALVAAFPTYRARGAIRELGKALGLPAAEIERIARASEGFDGSLGPVGKDIEVALGERARAGRFAWLARLAGEAHGLPRHLSQHPGGMIVSTRPLIDCCPVVPAAMEGRQMVQWDKESCADAGFLKIDLLGLGMLSAVERCVESIARHRGERIDLSRIPIDDPKVYRAIQEADTVGVFQIESRAQMQSLLRTRPASLEELTIQVAIIRPGPIQGGAVNPYIERLQRSRVDPGYEVPYEHPALAEPLRETLGTIIFQDQVIDVAMAFAGFTAGEAEGLRRAMSKKRSVEAIEAHHRRFVRGALARGADRATAERVFAKIAGFSGFGFPKAHAAAFGLLAYQSTWLRVHYGREFLCSLMNEQPMGFYPPDALVHEAKRRDIEVLPPDVNESGVECDLSAAGAVRVGLGYVKGAVREEVEALVRVRDAEGPFRGADDLAARAGAGGRSLEALAWAGACDGLVHGDLVSANRRRALWQLGVATPGVAVSGGTQLSLGLDLPAPPDLRPLGEWEEMLGDYETTGMTVRAHPIAIMRSRLDPDLVTSVELANRNHGDRVSVGGMVVARQRPATASGVVFILLEDELGTMNLIVPARVYERHRLAIRTEPLLLAEGRVERHASAGGAVNVAVSRVGPLEPTDRDVAQIAHLNREGGRVQPWDGNGDERSAAAAGRGGASKREGDFRAVAPAVMSFGRGRSR